MEGGSPNPGGFRATWQHHTVNKTGQGLKARAGSTGQRKILTQTFLKVPNLTNSSSSSRSCISGGRLPAQQSQQGQRRDTAGVDARPSMPRSLTHIHS